MALVIIITVALVVVNGSNFIYAIKNRAERTIRIKPQILAALTFVGSIVFMLLAKNKFRLKFMWIGIALLFICGFTIVKSVQEIVNTLADEEDKSLYFSEVEYTSNIKVFSAITLNVIVFLTAIFQIMLRNYF